TASADQTARLWDVTTGRERRVLEGHIGDVNAVAFSSDGRMLATCSSDTTVLLWDISGVAPEPRVNKTLSLTERKRAWDALAGADAMAAHQAIQNLIGDPDGAPALLADRVRPAPRLDEKRVQQWLDDLRDAKFAVRERAMRDLSGLGDRAIFILSRRLETETSQEARPPIQPPPPDL